MAIKIKQAGFTIIETLIVLAVTSAVFLSTSMLIRGQVARSSHREATFTLQSHVRDVINDVRTGYFPSVLSAGGGTNNTVVLGKKITFTPSSDVIQIDTVTAPVDPATGALNGPIDDNPTGVPDRRETKNIPGSLTYKTCNGANTDCVFYILYDKPTASGADLTSTSLGVGIYSTKDYGTFVNPVKACFEGYNFASITLARSDSPLEVELNAKDDTC